MSVPVIFSNDTRTTLTITPKYDQNSASPGSLVSLTGAVSAAVVFQNTATATFFTGTGVATVTTTVNYKPSSADLNAPNVPAPGGVYALYVTVTYSDGSTLPLQPDLIQIVTAP